MKKNYNISSEKFIEPLVKELIEELAAYFESINTDFCIVGAGARDIILKLHELTPSRATRDLDVAITISDWSKYSKISSDLENKVNFSKENKIQHRFYYKNIIPLDIIPHGENIIRDDKIFWPPDEQFEMSVLGFHEAVRSSSIVTIDDKVKINVVNFDGLFILKIIAWKDRHNTGNKDAEDIGLILNNYLEMNMEEALEHHFDIYEVEEFNQVTAGAKLLGRHIKEILGENEKIIAQFSEILYQEISKAEESLLFSQIDETTFILNIDEIVDSFQNIYNEITAK